VRQRKDGAIRAAAGGLSRRVDKHANTLSSSPIKSAKVAETLRSAIHQQQISISDAGRQYPVGPVLRILSTSSFIRANMQGRGGLLVSEYWPHLYDMLYARNPKHRRTLTKYAPEAA